MIFFVEIIQLSKYKWTWRKELLITCENTDKNGFVYIIQNKIKQIQREIVILEFIEKLKLLPIYENSMFDLNVFICEMWSYLF